MAKLAVFTALFVTLLAVAQANRFTITTTVDEDDVNQGGQRPMQMCQQQIQQQMQQIRHCQRYLSSGMMMTEDAAGIEEVVGQSGPQMMQPHLRQCCMTLRNFNEQCRCEAVRAAFGMACSQQQQGQGGWQGQGGQMMEQMRMKARFLPQQCNMGPQQCRV
ncbi:OLC1v1035669C1 [Oldenlandia corymbosa var. corymbosa]|uniref:OLC1v1035669C1 n=1 Tax=Oldenlandia corymbosa var. corymbosa TaxID=529605 RepID=A0AAV1CU73_OLDCO|nr:OLC1v1035669C1 [Oldenlandia corymbosa var. corymbosa]